MANSQDRELNSISVDTSLEIDGNWTELKNILIIENLDLKDYCFVTFSAEKVYKYNSENNPVTKLSIKHSPKINRCSHCDIIMKPGSMLSNAKFKKLKRSLAKMVHEIVFEEKTANIEV